MRSNRSTRHKNPRRVKIGPAPPPRSIFELATTWTLLSSSQGHTDRLGQAIGRTLKGGETIALYGPLGAGKTALVRGIAQGLGAPPTAVSSPTFVLIHQYRGRLPLAHVDLYRIDSKRALDSTGLVEYFSGHTVAAIEWADKGLAVLPQDRLDIALSHLTTKRRSIRLQATGPQSMALLARTRSRYSGGHGTARTAVARRSNTKGTTGS